MRSLFRPHDHEEPINLAGLLYDTCALITVSGFVAVALAYLEAI